FFFFFFCGVLLYAIIMHGFFPPFPPFLSLSLSLSLTCFMSASIGLDRRNRVRTKGREQFCRIERGGVSIYACGQVGMGNCCCRSFLKEDGDDAAMRLTPRQRLLALFGMYAPHLLKDVDDILRDYNHDGVRAVRYYCAVLGPEPKLREAKRMYTTHLTEADIALRKHIHGLLIKYDPTRIVELESIVRTHEEEAKRGGKETAAGLIQRLEQHYLGGLVGETLAPPLPLQGDECSTTDGVSAPVGAATPFPTATAALSRSSHAWRGGKRGGANGGVDGDFLCDFDDILARSRKADFSILLPYRPPAPLTPWATRTAVEVWASQ
ncbi:hypothetical protein MOQ_000672, partial [Trypanosoma cruzi marinkellei]